MGKLKEILITKIMPARRKRIWINFRRGNGAWVSFTLKPSTKEFRYPPKDTTPYYIKGRPDLEDFTNQRIYTFVEGVNNPINFDSQHPDLIQLQKEKGNLALLLTEAEEQGYQKAMLLKTKKGMDIQLLTFILIAVNLLATIFFGWIILDSMGVSFI